MKLCVISADTVKEIISMEDAVNILEKAFLEYSRDCVSMPHRINMELSSGSTITMPAYINGSETGAVKIVSVFDNNHKIGLPTVNALINVIDSNSGMPLAVMDGTEITAIRTGAAGGLATKLISRENSSICALIGAGKQAIYQLRGVMSSRRIKELRIFDKSISALEKFKEQAEKEFPELNIVLSKNTAEALYKADIITCITNSKEPVFSPKEVSKGTHINGIGSYTRKMKEVPIEKMQDIKVYADGRQAVMAEAGEIIQAIKEGVLKEENIIEIGQLIERKDLGRTNDSQITFFKSVGLAIQDTAIANYIYQKVIKLNKAQFIEL